MVFSNSCLPLPAPVQTLALLLSCETPKLWKPERPVKGRARTRVKLSEALTSGLKVPQVSNFNAIF